MIYVIADLHGYYKLYKKALERIHFSDADTLYVLGDVCDRGKEPMTILLDMMKRKNVIPIMGNHDRAALAMLKKEMEEADEPEDDPFGMPAAPRTDRAYMEWLREGGKTTVQDFARLSGAEKEAVIAYLERFLPYAEVSVDGREYVLVHANLGNFLRRNRCLPTGKRS